MSNIASSTPAVTGVYKITFAKNRRCYIGAATNIKRRIKDHLKKLRHNYHYNHKLQLMFNKYGELEMRVFILETCSAPEILDKEQGYLSVKRPKLNIYKNQGSILKNERSIYHGGFAK